MPRLTIRNIGQLLSRSNLNPETGCRIWNGSKNKRGYGRLGVDNKLVQAHRYSYELSNGKIPDGLYVTHKCDTPACIEPTHLSVGSQQDNMDEMVQRCRSLHRKGSKNPKHTLIESDIPKIRALRVSGMTYQSIASIFNVQLPTIWKVTSGKTWVHVK